MRLEPAVLQLRLKLIVVPLPDRGHVFAMCSGLWLASGQGRRPSAGSPLQGDRPRASGAVETCGEVFGVGLRYLRRSGSCPPTGLGPEYDLFFSVVFSVTERIVCHWFYHNLSF